MAQFQSLYSYRPNPKPEDMSFQLQTGEDVQLLPNNDVFQENGQLKPAVKFSVGQDVQLFTLSWPIQCLQKVMTQSRWRLVLTRATTDRISNFTTETAENLCSNSWKAVKDVCSECHKEFGAYLISMSCQEVIFTHTDSSSAERMKESNEMVDIMNKLLADTEQASYSDIMVDWDVSVEPCQLPSQHVGTPPSLSNLSSLVFDGDPADEKSLHSTSSTASEGGEEEGPSPLKLVLEMIQRESQKSQEALAKMATDNERRHRMVCHHLEEIKNTLHDFERRLCLLEKQHRTEGRPESVEDFRGSESDHHSTPSENSSFVCGPSDGPPRPPPQESSREPPGRNTHADNSSKPPPQDHSKYRPDGRETEGEEEEDMKSHSDFYQRETSRASETFTDTGEKETLSGSDLENHNLDLAVERAYWHDPVPPPKAKSYYTVLCLDISESMKENGAGEEMLKFVNKFIADVEDSVGETGVEENIGVVTFGDTSNVVQNLTNDFSLVQGAIDAIEFGGRSPFVQALLVSMAAFVEKAGIISVDGVYDVRPRIIFISDGQPTENTEGGPDVPYNKMHVRSALTKLMMNFATKSKYDKVRPVFYIPVGKGADKALLESMAKLSEGVYLEPKDLRKLCNYYVVQDTIGKTLAVLKKRSKEGVHDDGRIQAVAASLMPNLSPEEQKEVLTVVKRELKNPTKQKHPSRYSDLEDMFEDTDKVNAGERLKLGTRVVRGPDWKYGDQDGGGPGTVISHKDKENWTWVMWDSGRHNRYAYGPDLGFHIFPVDDQPLLMGEDGELKIGMTVEKGPDWNYGEECLQGVKTGVVIRNSRREKKLMVRWDNGERQVVRYGCDDMYDVIYRNPLDLDREPPLQFASAYGTNQTEFPRTEGKKRENQQEKQKPPQQDFANGSWQWKERGDWHDYPDKMSETIDKAYKKKQDGSCIIAREGTNRRVLFRRMVEREVEGGMELPVRRIPADR